MLEKPVWTVVCIHFVSEVFLLHLRPHRFSGSWLLQVAKEAFARAQIAAVMKRAESVYVCVHKWVTLELHRHSFSFMRCKSESRQAHAPALTGGFDSEKNDPIHLSLPQSRRQHTFCFFRAHISRRADLAASLSAASGACCGLCVLPQANTGAF